MNSKSTKSFVSIFDVTVLVYSIVYDCTYTYTLHYWVIGIIIIRILKKCYTDRVDREFETTLNLCIQLIKINFNALKIEL